MLGAHGRRAGRGRQTDGGSGSTSPDQGGSVTWFPKVCSALLPALLPLVITFRRLEPNGHTGPQVTVMGCLTASDHCCGQGIPATGVLQQHRPAQALFEGFRTRPRPRAIYSDSVGWMGMSLVSGTCPRTGAALVMTLCTGVFKRHVNVCATPELRGNPTVRIWAPLCCKVTLQCSWR